MQNFRKCQACMKIQDKKQMIKITKTQNGEIIINPNSKQIGRSCYVCKNSECLKIFIKKKRLQKSLGVKDIKMVEEIENSLKKLFGS